MLPAEGQRMIRVPLKISVSCMLVSRSGGFAKAYGNWRVNAQDFVAEYIAEYMQIGERVEHSDGDGSDCATRGGRKARIFGAKARLDNISADGIEFAMEKGAVLVSQSERSSQALDVDFDSQIARDVNGAYLGSRIFRVRV